MASDDQARDDKQSTLAILREIHGLLAARLPEAVPRRPWWKPRPAHVWTLALVVSLFFIDFPSESGGRADIVVLNGAAVSIAKLPEPDWSTLGMKPPPDYWRVPNLAPQIGILSLWELSLFRQGQRYKHSAIRVLRRDGEPLVDLLSPPVRVEGTTQIVLTPLADLSETELLMINRIVRTHALQFEDQLVPLTQIVDAKSQAARLIVEARPRIGWERFTANLSSFFNLLK